VRFTVAIPPEHRSSLEARLSGELREVLVWVDQGPADVAIDLLGEARFAHCARWPGLEGAAALLEVGFERLKDRAGMDRLHEVGRALASEQNLDRLLDLILTQARKLLAAEAGSIYLVAGEEDHRELLFAHTQNAKVNLPYHRFRMPISPDSMAGFVASTGQTLNIPDVHALAPDAPYRFNDSFDRQAGYRTESMLVVPMQDTEGQVLGVLQFINRVEEEPGGPDRIVPFLASHQAMAQSLAGQAGVAVKNAELREEIEKLLEGFVNASVTAIESRDPVTSGHSGRVASLTVGLAEAINATPNGIYADICFTDRQLREIRYASLLHDFGKVGVREQVLVKAKKLDSARLEMVLQRLRQRQLEQALEVLQQAWRKGEPFDPGRWEDLIRDPKAETERLIDLVRRSNEPALLPAELAEGLGLLDGLLVTHWSGQPAPIFEPQDLAGLKIRKGSLSESERLEIESHVTHTYRFLSQIPWTRDLQGVPDIAYAHHERLQGGGYPRRLMATEIPLQSKCMAITDVFDALTAQDRPYKAAVPVARSLDILGMEVQDGHLDGQLLGLFIEARVFERSLRTG
jgi:HD-GYP domain-containing protein (c-di-GMP phosphodiesterase class II)